MEVPTFEEHDLFNKKKLAEDIIKVSNAKSEPIIYMLDGPWGSGKTYFINQFIKHCDSLKIPVIHFDAFKHDISRDAFASLVGCVAKYAEQSDPKNELKNQIIKAGSKVGLSLLRGGASTIISLASGGLITSQVMDGAGENLKNAVNSGIGSTLNSLTETALEEWINSQTENEVRIQDFRDILTKVVKKSIEHTDAQKAYFIIDELDRCRPNFSIEIIECIKHIFNIDNIDFIITTDKNHLENSLSHLYGQNINTTTYLEKFYDLRINFYRSSHSELNNAKKYIRHLCLQHLNSNANSIGYALELLNICANTIRLSFRDIKKIIIHLSILQHLPDPNYGVALFPLIFLRQIDNNLYLSAIRKEVSAQEIMHKCGLRKESTEYYNDLESSLHVLIFKTTREDNNLDQGNLDQLWLNRINIPLEEYCDRFIEIISP
ncbi:KAP family P-loop NTPase fold protein [Woodsholea maritima]|uniref:KAP family P-loop NTPase fold protein n=1 Tax=Woodsholea maritima TaxID=240237 RepID=UPI00035DF952|nr:P-loop NTPase fold protein [Woodsholea maritima]